jgi:hypothetical protein
MTNTARAIVRFSLDQDQGSKLRNKIADVLLAAEFQRLSTGTYEAYEKPIESLIDALHETLTLMKTPPEGCSVDHVWIYLDTGVYVSS